MWKNKFSKKILEKSLEYYKESLVNDFKYTKTNIEACVNDYNVNITLKDSKINDLYCDCRCKYCIHQAAVLYYFDNHKDYSNLASLFTYEELVDFLNKELPNNPELENNLKIYKNLDVDEEYFKNKLNKSFTSYVKVINFINTDLEKLKTIGQIDLLLELLKSIVTYLDELNDIGMYDEYDIILDKIGELLNNLINFGYVEQVLSFLEYHILNSKDETICDYFGYIYSQFGDVEELFE